MADFWYDKTLYNEDPVMKDGSEYAPGWYYRDEEAAWRGPFDTQEKVREKALAYYDGRESPG